MRIICVIAYLADVNEIEKIENLFPCFVDITRIDTLHIEVMIKCRQEDAGSIESLLAKFV